MGLKVKRVKEELQALQDQAVLRGSVVYQEPEVTQGIGAVQEKREKEEWLDWMDDPVRMGNLVFLELPDYGVTQENKGIPDEM
ncbi:unnamed protein product [Leuciscus chuanchicus]